MTLEEFLELPEDNSRRFEVKEGVLIVAPRHLAKHQRAANRLAQRLNDQLPDEWEGVTEIDVVVRPGFPPDVRVPDVVVVRSKWIDDDMRVASPEDVLLAVEVISPGSRDTDTVLKPVEYAEAGIPYYLVIDLDPPVSLTAYHLAGDLGYQEAPAVTGEFITQEPFSLRIDLTKLAGSR
ncbi:Uma2 family endonuclease [Longimycelium tulufanense]|uniref:Uma2 family endonuclease n=1 Tax=Longimycelium tulufanense TaxID=907463 RepID=UPI001E4E260C|nr:Uma2 family endonuclease [Longimycelium tulufanense]